MATPEGWAGKPGGEGMGRSPPNIALSSIVMYSIYFCLGRRKIPLRLSICYNFIFSMLMDDSG